jgi:hypothetical protein
METKNSPHAEIAHKVAACLKELGIEAEVRISGHEAVVYAKKDLRGTCLRVVTHVSDRIVQTAAGGQAQPEMARARLATASIRPTLAAQAAARQSTDPGPTQDPCR